MGAGASLADHGDLYFRIAGRARGLADAWDRRRRRRYAGADLWPRRLVHGPVADCRGGLPSRNDGRARLCPGRNWRVHPRRARYRHGATIDWLIPAADFLRPGRGTASAGDDLLPEPDQLPDLVLSRRARLWRDLEHGGVAGNPDHIDVVVSDRLPPLPQPSAGFR